MTTLKGKNDYPFYFGATAETLRLAGELRRSMTEAEKALWHTLRRKQLEGYRFRRQHPVKDFILDFFCYEAMLGIEVDGSVHEELTHAERDLERTRMLNELGINIIRFTNQQITTDMNNVIAAISEAVHQTKRDIHE